MSYNILIIGSGASGLMAADVLAEKNHAVTVVEARDRIGGRINTIHSKFSLSLEAGAEFMHGRQPLTLSLIEESKNEVSLLSGNRYQFWNGQLKRGDFFDDQWNLLTRKLEKLETDTDIATFLNEHFDKAEYKDLRQKVRGFVEGYDAADMHRVSALALKQEWAESDGEHQYRIPGGYSKLIEYLEEKIKRLGGEFQFSSPVKEIQWSEGKVKVFTETARVLKAEKVIITVPLGVLQKGTIRFNPPLPDHMKAFSQMGFGGVIKFFFEFKNAFWEDRISRPLKDVAFLFSDAEIPTWWSQLPDKTPLLTGWLGGPSTENISHDGDALYQKAVASLQYIFDCDASDIKNEIERWHLADWVKDPYSCGAYAYPTIHTAKARAFLSEPIKDTVYFAGEALYDGPAMGTVEAALVSGKDVARKMNGNPD